VSTYILYVLNTENISVSYVKPCNDLGGSAV